MSNRTVRVNELIKREISDILRKRYQKEAVNITIMEVRVAPDLRDGRVFISIVGDDATVEDRFQWLRRQASIIRQELSRRIVLKYLPKLEYVIDHSAERGTRIVQLLDELEPDDTTTEE